MLVHPWDAAFDDVEALEFARSQGFGHLIAPGAGRELPVVVPTQFLVAEASDAGEPAVVLLHLARPNPVWKTFDERPVALLSVAGDWSYVPSAWKAIGDEDPALGIPTTYYAAAQLVCDVEVVDDVDGKLAILRGQLAAYEPEVAHADPAVHERKLPGIRGVRLTVRSITGKFKYGGNVDAEHRAVIAERLAERDGPGDRAARGHLLRRSDPR